jgi:hypothetical protein
VLAAAVTTVAAAQLRSAAADLTHVRMPFSSSKTDYDIVGSATGVAWQGQPPLPQAQTAAGGGTWPGRRLNLDAAGAKSLPRPRPYMCVISISFASCRALM